MERPSTLRRGKNYYSWVICPQCQQGRWVQKGRKQPKVCRACLSNQNGYPFARGEKNPRWKGGRGCHGKEGYIEIKVYPEDFFFPMVDNRGYIFEHRLVMAKHLGRCLHSWERVHHKNGVKDDNRSENLELTTQSQHLRGHTDGYKKGYRQGYYDSQSRAIKELKEEIRLLRWQLLNEKELA